MVPIRKLPAIIPIMPGRWPGQFLSKECDRGILICGTGIGISIAANRYPGIRAANCTDCFMAEATRQHNDANILAPWCAGAWRGKCFKIVDTFLNTEFSNDERHIRRIEKIEGAKNNG